LQYFYENFFLVLLKTFQRAHKFHINYVCRFIYVETFYLWKWWLRQNEKVRADVKMLINEGRLEIIGGAWSMNDEACTHYHSLVDQFTWGFRCVFWIIDMNETDSECK